ncbi:hypothetical protein FOS14_21240 [Skermania sp. ID1734]|uniref:hypothetical protein n=1 Tax=Skermania sp. ID1734 TaxID=2597516 RepID=UPI0011805BA6|nr:hypothetical protein [Skermania sp. ID1734]TSD94280.1 hypothetical protein FOS14_21240 [Skermania sp. ID1734]
MSPDPQAKAAQLLDALVAYVVADATERFDEVVVREVDLVLAAADTLKLGAVVSPQDVQAAARIGIDRVGGSSVVSELVAPFADTFYNLDAASDYQLGEVIDRDQIQALTAAILRMTTAQERLFDKLMLSPLVAQLASRFVGKIVADFVAGNRKRAERVPGVSSLFSVGDKVASTAAKVGKGQLDAISGKSAEYTLKQTENAISDLIENAPVEETVLQVWDLHADEPVSELRKYLSEEENRELTGIGYDLVMSTRNKDYILALVDAWVETFFARFGETSLRELLEQLGIGREQLLDEARRFAPPVIDALVADGVLADQIRQRFEPFFASEAALTVLGAE